MSDKAQAEDRRAPLELAEALRVRAGCLSGQNWEVPATVAMMLESAATIERLSRVEQALRELTAQWRDDSDVAESEERPVRVGRAFAMRQCADELEAVLSASPEVQPEEGR